MPFRAASGILVAVILVCTAASITTTDAEEQPELFAYMQPPPGYDSDDMLGLSYPGPYPSGGSCNMNGPQTLCIGAPVGSNAVLQQAPAKSAVTGSVPVGYGKAPMTVTVTLVDDADPGGFNHSVDATVRPDRTWKVLLPPRPAFGNYSIGAMCTQGCSGENATFEVGLKNITFGDVYVCAGQSNMQLMMDYTFEVNKSVAAIKEGKYQNIRLFYG